MGNKKIKQSYIDEGVFKIGESDLEEIHQEIRRRATLALDYVKYDEEEESDKESDNNNGDECKVYI